MTKRASKTILTLNSQPFVRLISELNVYLNRSRKVVPLELLKRAIRVGDTPLEFARFKRLPAFGATVPVSLEGSDRLVKLVSAFRALSGSPFLSNK